MKTIQNACDVPLNQNSGTLPNMSETLTNTLQQMVFQDIKKKVVNGQVVETTNPINFQGSWIPFTIRQLMMKPEGQRRWMWFQVLALTPLPLSPDDVVTYIGKQFRVMQVNDFSLYGYYEYHLADDYQGVSP